MPAPARPLSALLLVLTLASAGCLSSGSTDAPPENPSPIVLTELGNEEEMTEGRGDAPHYHDYWGGKERLLVLEGEQGSGYTWYGEWAVFNVFQPEAGTVVPQGASSVEVTFTWTKGNHPLEGHGPPELFLQTAADDRMVRIGPVENGVPLVVESTNEKNDLPHQTLSAWRFGFGLPRPDDTRPTIYTGTVSVRVEAVRGLEIPIYPGHRDRWEGNTEYLLVDAGTRSLWMGNSNTGEWSCFGGCPFAYAPANGTIVPPGSGTVRAVLTLANGQPSKLGLSFHGADSREWTRLTPTSDDGKVRVYDIPVEKGMSDGPYNEQSQWEFMTFIEGPEPDSVVFEEFKLVIHVHKKGHAPS